MPHPQEIAGRNVRDYEGKKCRFHYICEVFRLSFQGCSLGQLGDQQDDRLKDSKLNLRHWLPGDHTQSFDMFRLEKHIFAKLLLYGGDKG